MPTCCPAEEGGAARGRPSSSPPGNVAAALLHSEHILDSLPAQATVPCVPTVPVHTAAEGSSAAASPGCPAPPTPHSLVPRPRSAGLK